MADKKRKAEFASLPQITREKDSIVKKTATKELVKHHVLADDFTRDCGYAQTWQWLKNERAAKEFVAELTKNLKTEEGVSIVYNAMENINRQSKTDDKNSLRAPAETPEKQELKEVKKLQKENPERFSDLLEFGKQLELVKSGVLKEVDPELKKRVLSS